MLFTAVPVQVPVGRVFYRDSEGQTRSCYFIVAAGVGADALFLSRLDAGLKQRFGYALYLVEAFRVWATHTFPMFAAAIVQNEGDAPRVEQVSQLLVVRISNFGGVLRNLAPGAALNNHHLRAIAFKTRSRLQYMRFLTAVVFARHTFGRFVELVKAVSVDCSDLAGSTTPLFIEADGELLGTLPARIEMVPQALTLLNPPKALPGPLHP
jgi:diacylglycerol kinase family enzyme